MNAATGSYVVVTYRGTPLPTRMYGSASSSGDLLSGGLVLRADSTYEAHKVERFGVFTRQECDAGGECRWEYSTCTRTETGTYAMAGSQLLVTPHDPTTRWLYEPVLQGDSVAAQGYVFRRQ